VMGARAPREFGFAERHGKDLKQTAGKDRPPPRIRAWAGHAV